MYINLINNLLIDGRIIGVELEIGIKLKTKIGLDVAKFKLVKIYET